MRKISPHNEAIEMQMEAMSEVMQGFEVIQQIFERLYRNVYIANGILSKRGIDDSEINRNIVRLTSKYDARLN